MGRVYNIATAQPGDAANGYKVEPTYDCAV